jgi:O-methyltransferase
MPTTARFRSMPTTARFQRSVIRAVLRTPLRGWLLRPHPTFMYSPPQLAFLGQRLEEACLVDGGILEVGCAVGHTTVFLNRWLDAVGVDKPYRAIDTFAGFTDDDLAAEALRGNGAWEYLKTCFRMETKESFDYRMKANGISRVVSIEADAATLDYSAFGSICFALIDVDVHRPVAAALAGIYPNVPPGGVVIVDDCAPTGLWLGAYLAYVEFCERNSLQPDIRHTKLGIIRKPTPE